MINPAITVYLKLFKSLISTKNYLTRPNGLWSNLTIPTHPFFAFAKHAATILQVIHNEAQ